jgi:hypothetical protein
MEIPVKRPELPELNRELLIKVVDHALSAENWEQSVWFTNTAATMCGTAMCVAGFAAIEFAGWKPVIPHPNASSSYLVNKAEEVQSIREVAQDFLGLTVDEANDLFHSINNERDVRRITEAILSGEYRS